MASNTPSSLPVQFTIPDLFIGWPYECIPNPDQSTINKSARWVESYQILPPRAQALFNQDNYGLLAACFYPQAQGQLFRTGCDMMNIFFLIELFTDGKGSNEVRQHVSDFMNALRYPWTVPSGKDSILGAMTRCSWQHALEAASPSSAERFIAHCEKYLNAVIQEADDRDTDYLRSVDEYLMLRPETSGTYPSLIILSLDSQIPEQYFRHPAVKSLEECTVRLVSFSNDIYSWNKEQARGEDTHNLVTVIMRERDSSLQEAMDQAGELYFNVSQQFLKEVDNLPSIDPEYDDLIKDYCDSLGTFVTEIWQLVGEYINVYSEHSTLHALTLVSHGFHQVFEPILYSTIAIYPPKSIESFPKDLGSADVVRRSMVKHIAISFLIDGAQWPKMNHFTSTLPQLPVLRSLIFRREPGRRIQSNELEEALYSSNNLQHLDRFTWVRIPVFKPDSFLSFILSLDRVQHLDLDTSFTLPNIPEDALPHLRTFGGNLKSVLKILQPPGTRKIDKIRTDHLSGCTDIIPDGFQSRGVRVLMCDHSYGWGIENLINCFPNVQFLELNRAYGSWLYELPSALSSLSSSNSIRFIRFAHDSTGRGSKFISYMFEHLPLLECIEVQREIPQSRPASLHVQKGPSERWYRSTDLESVMVQWSCPVGEEWWQDWENDVYTVE
ncbi:hypothetical protein ONZ45_g9174 [Pleurotus djamor]|nr:hypothetical protein ONZ45_g9174 [Pleurotus djamor]